MDEPRFVPLSELIRAASAAIGEAADGLGLTGPEPDPADGAAGPARARPAATFSPFVPAADPAIGGSESSATEAAGERAGLAAESLTIVADLTQTAAAIREARLFRAALTDAFDLLADSLAHRLAQELLGRELQLAPVDLQEIAARVLAQAIDSEPLRLRVSAADAAVACELPVVVDESLAAGDAVVECRSGGIDARLTVRLAQVVAGIEW